MHASGQSHVGHRVIADVPPRLAATLPEVRPESSLDDLFSAANRWTCDQ